MYEDRCEHLMLVGQCALCKPPPEGVRPHGYRTKGGRAYHNDRQCEWLVKGQNASHRQGFDVHAVERVAWGAVSPGELQPCEFCCAPTRTRRRHEQHPAPRSVRCLVREGEDWFSGELTWEDGRRPDGLWWAEVRYHHAGAEVVVVTDERRLRPRP